MIEVASHPITLVGGGCAVYYGAAKFIDMIQSRSIKKKRLKSKRSVEELELWHQLWTHPDVSVTFYQWSEEGGFTERPVEEVVKLLLSWDSHTRGERYEFQFKVSPHITHDSEWGPETYRAVIEYGIWNAVELMDSTWRVGTFERPFYNGSDAHVWYRNSEDGYVCDCGVRSNFLPGVDKSSSELSSLKRRAKKLRLDIINASNANVRVRLLRRYKELMEEIERYS